MSIISELLSFWFQDDGMLPPATFRPIWFDQDDAFDARLRVRFETDVVRVARGDYDDIALFPQGALTLILLLDQLPRNLYRDTPQAYETDQKAIDVAKYALDHKFDEDLDWTKRLFMYLPFQHAEDLDLQERSVTLFATLANDSSMDAAMNHWRLIKDFGRFPHRNAVLGRLSTQAESSYLAAHGRGF